MKSYWFVRYTGILTGGPSPSVIGQLVAEINSPNFLPGLIRDVIVDLIRNQLPDKNFKISCVIDFFSELTEQGARDFGLQKGQGVVGNFVVNTQTFSVQIQ